MFRLLCGLVATTLSVLLAYGVPLIRFVKRGGGAFVVRRDHPTRYCDLYVPEKARSNALFVFIHGGGWHSGDKGAAHWVGHAFVGEAMASDGVLTAVLTYPRAHIPLGSQVVVFAALALFALCLALVLSLVLFSLRFWLRLAALCYVAVSVQIWLREFATSGTHPSATAFDQMTAVRDTLAALRKLFPEHRVVLAGHSAGGHLAALYATMMGAVSIDTLVGISGVYDVAALARMRGPLGSFVHEFCLRPAFSGLSLEKYSPLNHAAHLQAKRVVLVSARCDQPALEAQADALYAALTAHAPWTVLGSSDVCTKMRVTGLGLGHGFGLVWSEELWTLVRKLCS